MIHVIVTMVGAETANFIKEDHAPVLMRGTFQVRAILESDGRLFCPADWPVESRYLPPHKVIGVELTKE